MPWMNDYILQYGRDDLTMQKFLLIYVSNRDP